MNRRRLLHAICIAMAGASLPGMARAASRNRVAVVGVGGAGANLAIFMRASGLLGGAEAATTYLCVDADERTAQRVRGANAGAPHLPALQSLLLDGKQATTGEELPSQLCRLVDMSDTVVLLAGLGGTTGSSYSRLIAQAARRQGVETVAAVVLPFSYEGRRIERASSVLAELQAGASRVIASPNDALAERYGSDLPLAAAFDRQERELAGAVRQAIGLYSPSGSV